MDSFRSDASMGHEETKDEVGPLPNNARPLSTIGEDPEEESRKTEIASQ